MGSSSLNLSNSSNRHFFITESMKNASVWSNHKWHDVHMKIFENRHSNFLDIKFVQRYVTACWCYQVQKFNSYFSISRDWHIFQKENYKNRKSSPSKITEITFINAHDVISHHQMIVFKGPLVIAA